MMVLDKLQLRAKFEVVSFSFCRNIKGKPTFSSGCDFMISLGKTQWYAKCEAASPNRCKNIKREPLNFGRFPSPGSHPLFLFPAITLPGYSEIGEIFDG